MSCRHLCSHQVVIVYSLEIIKKLIILRIQNKNSFLNSEVIIGNQIFPIMIKIYGIRCGEQHSKLLYYLTTDMEFLWNTFFFLDNNEILFLYKVNQ